MSDNPSDDQDSTENSDRVPTKSRPSKTQLNAIITFMNDHPNLATNVPVGANDAKYKVLWEELAAIANCIDINGTIKSTSGWMQFWHLKRRFVLKKLKLIKQGKKQYELTPLDIKVLEVSKKSEQTRRKHLEHKEPCEVFDKLIDSTEPDERQLDMIDKIVDVMDQQSTALNQMAQASLSNSKAMEQIAEASHFQALAVNRLAGTFDSISATVHDVRNAILGIDYTIKRCYPTSQQRQNNIFS